jgi:hypothetical protein
MLEQYGGAPKVRRCRIPAEVGVVEQSRLPGGDVLGVSANSYSSIYFGDGFPRVLAQPFKRG